MKNNEYTKQQLKYIESVDGKAHMSAVEIIGKLENDLMYNFGIGDIVSLKNSLELFEVVGVIHDDKSLYLKDYANTLSEFDVKFDDVEFHWRKL